MKVTRKGLIGLAVALVIIVPVFGYLCHLNGGSANFLDTEVRVVISSSMDGEPREEYEIETIPVGSLVFIHKVPSGMEDAYGFYKSLKVGDVVTFHYTNPVSRENMVVTHRIVEIANSGGDIKFTMVGDSIVDLNDEPGTYSEGETQVVYASSGEMIGKVVGVSPELGSFVIYISSAQGKAVLIGLFATFIAAIWIAPVIFRHLRDKNKECD